MNEMKEKSALALVLFILSILFTILSNAVAVAAADRRREPGGR